MILEQFEKEFQLGQSSGILFLRIGHFFGFEVYWTIPSIAESVDYLNSKTKAIGFILLMATAHLPSEQHSCRTLLNGTPCMPNESLLRYTEILQEAHTPLVK